MPRPISAEPATRWPGDRLQEGGIEGWTAGSFLATLSAASAATMLGGAPAFAGKSDDALNIAWIDTYEAIDPYYDTTREGLILTRHVFDTLLFRDPKTLEYTPLLATSYKWIDDTTLEFELRRDVKFHNGDAFSADDVVGTFNHVVKPDSGIKVRSIVDWMKSAEKLDDYRLRIHLQKPFPTALEFLSSQLGIYSFKYFTKVGPEGVARAPIGTGPYKVTAQETGKSAVLEKFAGYFEGSPKGKPSIGKLLVRVMPDVTTQVAELMTGSLDWIWRVSPDLMKNLASVPNLKVLSAETMRFTALSFDAAGRAGKSPIQDQRVRQAFAYAINRKAIRDHLIGGDSHVLDAACFPSQFGCTDDVAKYAYDPDKAKHLLAEAGFAGGFEVPLLSWASHTEVEAVVADLAKIGVTVKVRLLQSPVVRKMMSDGEATIAMISWGSYSINDVSASTSLYFDGGGYDMARDAQVTQWLKEGDNSTDAEFAQAQLQAGAAAHRRAGLLAAGDEPGHQLRLYRGSRVHAVLR